MAAAGLYTRGTYLTSFRDTTFILVQHRCPMLAASTAYSEQRTAAWAWAFCICGALSLAPRLLRMSDCTAVDGCRVKPQCVLPILPSLVRCRETDNLPDLHNSGVPKDHPR